VIREPVKPKADPVKPKPEPVKPKPEPVKPKIEATKPAPREAEMQKRLRDELAREQTALSIDQEKKLLQDQVARDQALQAQSALNKARATYGDKIKAKIKGNIVLPQDLKGNPEAVFEVVQLPTGEVLSVRLKKSSGHRGYDEAVERAILKASPLPLPERAEVFSRALSLTFRPQD
jgi:colicin import membrane protein